MITQKCFTRTSQTICAMFIGLKSETLAHGVQRNTECWLISRIKSFLFTLRAQKMPSRHDTAIKRFFSSFVPGSHLSGRQPNRSIPHPVVTVAITGPEGLAIAFDGRLWRDAAANNTSQSRFRITVAGFGFWSRYGHTGNPNEEVISPGENALGPLYRDNNPTVDSPPSRL